MRSKFELGAVVLATETRWDRFRKDLNGEAYLEYPDPLTLVKRQIKRFLPKSVLNFVGIQSSPQEVTSALLGSTDVPVWECADVNSPQFIDEVRQANPDLLISAAYPQIFSGQLLDVPTLGAVNFHPSLLPKFRGAHPHFWAIATGAKTSVVTAHFMTEDLDKGDIIAQISFPIEAYAYSELYEKIVAETPGLVADVESFFFDGNASARPQDDREATFFRNDRDVHRRIFWNTHSAEKIIHLIRTERAFCFFRNRRVTLLQAATDATNRNLTNNVAVEPGIVVDLNGKGIVIKALDGGVSVQVVESRCKRWPYEKWAQKCRLAIGEQFS